MTTRKALLLGILFGQILMLPYIYYLYTTPRIEALVIPAEEFDRTEIRHLQIQHLPNTYGVGGSTLNIYLASEREVNRQYNAQFDDETQVEGFYNIKTHTIWCVYDPLVLHHEIRHVTEGSYHR